MTMFYKLLFIFFSSCIAYSQSNLEIVYKKKVLPKYLNVDDSLSIDKKQSYLKVRNSIKNHIGKHTYSLSIDSDSDVSLFEVDNTMDIDGNERFNNSLKGILGSRFPIYNNLEKDSIYENADFRGINYFTRYKSPRYDWNLKNKTKQILGFKCYLAVAKVKNDSTLFDFKEGKTQSFYAWYAPSLPSRYGPSFFTGLPGLVLKAGNDKFEIYAVKIKENGQSNFKFPNKASITENQKLMQLKNLIRE